MDLFWVVALDRDPVFWGMDTARILIAGYVIGGVYGAFASFFNRDLYAFDGVQDSLLTALADVDATVRNRSWRGDVAPCFYNLVDNDKSLSQKSKGIYFNGFLVTTSFDAIWISLVAILAGAIWFIISTSWSFILMALAILSGCYLVWRLSIARHCRLGEEQVIVIKKRFSAELQDCLAERRKQEQDL